MLNIRYTIHYSPPPPPPITTAATATTAAIVARHHHYIVALRGHMPPPPPPRHYLRAPLPLVTPTTAAITREYLYHHFFNTKRTHLGIGSCTLALDFQSTTVSNMQTTRSSSGEEKQQLQLYSYHMSSCAFRVRIALNLKGLDYEYKAVNLLKGEQHSPDFLKVNPIGYVPALVDGDMVIVDSFAIIMYLEEKYPQHPLLPRDLEKKAINYQAANIVSASIQPLLNLRVLNYIEEKVGPDAKVPWVQKHIGKGFAALEKLLKYHAGKYATGDDIFLIDGGNLTYTYEWVDFEADLFLIPQIYGGIKMLNLDMTPYPLLTRLYETYIQLPAIQDAMPEKQPDFPSS